MEERKFPKSQSEALRQDVTYYFTGKPCKHGHYSERFAKNRNCRECLRIRNRNRTQAKDYWIDYGDEEYKERKREYAKKYYRRNAHKRGVQKRRRFEKAARVSTRKGAIELRRIRLEAQLLSIDTGVKHVQILTKAQNRQKASRFNQDEQSRIQMEILKKKPDESG